MCLDTAYFRYRLLLLLLFYIKLHNFIYTFKVCLNIAYYIETKNLLLKVL